MRRRQFVVQGQSSAQLDDRFIKLPGAKQRRSQGIVRVGKLLILRKRGSISRDRLVRFSHSLVSEAEVVVSIGIRATAIRDCAVVSLDGFGNIALRVVGGAKPEKRFRELLRLFERLLLSADRFVEL